MNHPLRKITKPERWDQPFDDAMSSNDVTRLLSLAPFASMDESHFDSRLPLAGILQNDCRLVSFQGGDVLMRQGDYGGSVFLVLEGELMACLTPLPTAVLGRKANAKAPWWRSLTNGWKNPPGSERRTLRGDLLLRQKTADATPRVFVQDVPSVLAGHQTEPIQTGQLFGEVSALTRSPRASTVIAKSSGLCLEMRWQGFRDLLQRSKELKKFVDAAYRRHSLITHLSETQILKHLAAARIEAIAKRTELLSFGRMQWTSDFRSMVQADIAERIQSEPLIAGQGDYANGLFLVRSGFARVTRKQGVSEQTIEYLGRGRHFGLRELVHNFKSNEQNPWQLSLRAVGYVDVLLIPTDLVEKEILPDLPVEFHPPNLHKKSPTGSGAEGTRRQTVRQSGVETNLMEMLVENRLVNGTQAMVIDLNRCTRCDDCIRGCAAAHDNNPRFVRAGKVHENLMFANACMQCEDPVCMIGCPTGAIARDQATGVITINDQTCVGCQTCANSCPYNNIKMVAISDQGGLPIVDGTNGLPVLQATKCDLCLDQLGGPACQRACPHDALVRIDLTSPQMLTQWIKG